MTQAAPMFDLPSRSELSRRRSQLLSRIHQKFKTVSETHHIGPLRLDFTRVADPDAVLSGTPHAILGLLSGQVDLDRARAMGLECDGDPAVLRRVLPEAPRDAAGAETTS